MIKYLNPSKKKLTLAGVGIIFIAITEFFQPLIVKRITDDGLIRQDLYTVIFCVLLLLGVVLVNRFVEVGLSSLFVDIHNESEFYIYSKSFEKLLKLKAEYFTDKNASEVINTLSTDVNMVSSLTDRYNVMLISFIFRIISGMAGLIVISPVLTLLVLTMVPVKYLMVKKLAKKREEETTEYLKGYGGFAAWMSDVISGIKEIKLWNGYQSAEKEFAEKEQELLRKNKKFTMSDTWNTFAEIFLEWAINGLLYVFGGMLLIKGVLTLGGLFAFISYSSYVTSPISAVLNIKMIMARIMPSARRLFAFMNLQEEPKGYVKNIAAGSIVFKNISFSYEDNRKVLDNISFTIPLNAKVAIIGANGSGKSTIISLLLRFLEAEKGEIDLTGKDIRQLDLNEYRDLFSVVSQAPYLFSKTIEENIDLKNSGDEQRLTYVYKKSGVADYLEKMPDKERSMIGENGARLSGGERQKLAVARALMKDTPFVILDEATSGFDVESDAYLHDMMIHEMKDKTVLLVTHRYENLEGLDIVYKIENGGILRIK